MLLEMVAAVIRGRIEMRACPVMLSPAEQGTAKGRLPATVARNFPDIGK